MSFILGILIGAAVLVSLVMQGGNAPLLMDQWSLLLVCGCTAASFLVICPFTSLRDVAGVAGHALFRRRSARPLLREVTELAAVARHSGVLGLEGRAGNVRDPLLKRGLELLLESADPAALRTILENDAERRRTEERTAQEVFERMAVFSPGIGMVGTLVQVVRMLGHFTVAQSIAPQIAHALLPLLYGGVLSYLLLFPLAARIRISAARQQAVRQFVIESVLALQAGEPPRMIEQRFNSILK